MWKKANEAKKFFLDLFFPKFCLNCQKEGDFLCEDCNALLEISPFHRNFSSRGLEEHRSSPPFAATRALNDLYIPLSYQNPLVKSLIRHFKYEPFVKELATTLASLIISHFQLLDNRPDFSEYILASVPLSKKRLKWRGYNQAEELGKELAVFFKIPLVSDCLLKIKETALQMELAGEARKENIKDAFLVKNPDLIKGRKILLIDDVYTTGSTMEECSRALRMAGAKEIIGIAIAGD